jgi:hypothetical protein
LNEQMIFQQVSQLSFQGIMMGKDPKTALDEAEAVVKDIIERTKKLSAQAQAEGKK